jgi:fructan beta-fructosidase
VVRHAGRDPKLVWYEKGKHWVMAVYDELEGKRWIAFHTSPDLKTWTYASRIEGFYECPDLFELVVDGHPRNGRKWVLYAADGKYLTGDFDGKVFKPDAKEKKQLWYGRFYAAQTFENPPGKHHSGVEYVMLAVTRRVQIGWAQGITFPGMSFNQQMTVPVELDLVKDGDTLQLAAWPVSGLRWLREEEPAFEVEPDAKTAVAKRTILGDNLDAFDADLTIDLKKATGFTLDLRGTKLTYDATKEALTCKDVTAPVKTKNGVLKLRVLVDRGSVEVFPNTLDRHGIIEGSFAALSVAALPDEKNRKLELTPVGGEIGLPWASVYRMKSAWEK